MNVIKLEQTKNSLVGEIIKLEFFNDYIFVQDESFQGLLIFDIEGNFVKTFNKQGKGPGEYMSFRDFIIDTENNTIEVFDKPNNKILVYDVSDFGFKGSFSVPVEFVFRFIKNKSVYYFQTNGMQNKINDKYTNSDIIAFNTRTLELTPLFDRDTPSSNQFLEFSNVFYKNDDDEIFVSLAWEQTVYHVYDNHIYPVIIINPGDRGVPKSILEGSPDDKLNFIFSGAGKNKIGGFRLLFYQDNCIILAYGMGNSTKQLLFFSFQGGVNSFATNMIVNDLSTVKLPDIDVFKVSNNEIISVIYPFDIENKQILDNLNLSKNDNPSIIKYKLKINI